MSSPRRGKGRASKKTERKSTWRSADLLSPQVSRRRWLILSLTGLVAVGAGVGLWLQRNKSVKVAHSSDASEAGKPYRLRENRPVLPATLFSGIAAVAYRQAAEIPRVLDQLYCYCRCKENFGHKNLLTCFATRHGAG